MSIENIIITGSIGLIFSGIGWAVKQSIIGELRRIGKDLGDLRTAVNGYREEMIRDYCRTSELHDIRNEVRDMRDKLLQVKTVQDNCRTCSGRD